MDLISLVNIFAPFGGAAGAPGPPAPPAGAAPPGLWGATLGGASTLGGATGPEGAPPAGPAFPGLYGATAFGSATLGGATGPDVTPPAGPSFPGLLGATAFGATTLGGAAALVIPAPPGPSSPGLFGATPFGAATLGGATAPAIPTPAGPSFPGLFGATPSGATTFGGATEAAPSYAIALEQGLAAYLAALPGLAAIVGARIFPGSMPEDAALPALAYTVVSRQRVMSLDGGAGLADARVEIGVESPAYADCSAAIELLAAALTGFQGNLAGVAVIACVHDDEATAYDPPPDAGDVGTHTLSTDFKVRYRTPAPTPNPR